MPYQHFYELDVWKRARQFKLKVYAILKCFPAHEEFELKSQLRRSVRSIAANVSEGHGRRTPRDEYHFCVIARGSLSETLNHLIDAMDSAYISREELRIFKTAWDELRKVLNGYMTFLQSKAKAGTSANPASGDLKENDILYNRNIAEKEETLLDFFQHLESLPV